MIDVGVTHHLVLVSHSQHLVVAQRLVEGDETQLGVEGVFVALQQAGALYLVVVGATRQSQALHIARHRVDAAHRRRVDQRQQVVGSVIGQTHPRAIHARIARIGLTKVSQGQNVAVLRDSGTHIGAPYLDTQNADV